MTRSSGISSRATSIRMAEREALVLNRRKAGATLQDIASELGLRHSGQVSRIIRNALRKSVREPADEVRAIEVARLDALWHEMFRMVVGDGIRFNVLDPDTMKPTGLNSDGTMFVPSQRAVDRCLRIMTRRAELLGLDAPKVGILDDRRAVEEQKIREIIVELPAGTLEATRKLDDRSEDAIEQATEPAQAFQSSETIGYFVELPLSEAFEMQSIEKT